MILVIIVICVFVLLLKLSADKSEAEYHRLNPPKPHNHPSHSGWSQGLTATEIAKSIQTCQNWNCQWWLVGLRTAPCYCAYAESHTVSNCPTKLKQMLKDRGIDVN